MASALRTAAASAEPARATAGQPPCLLARFPPTTDQNPYQRLLYRHLAGHGVQLASGAVFSGRWLWRQRRRVHVLHFHWRPDRYYDWPDDWTYAWRPPRLLRRPLAWLKLAVFALRLGFARALGFRLVWTIHEVHPQLPISRRLDRAGARMLAMASHIRFAHDHATVERARSEIGRSVGAVHVVPHGSYVGFYPPGRPRAAVRRELGIAPGTFTFLCFGVVRAGKQIDLLLDAFGGVEHDAVLLVAGVPDDERSARAIEHHAARDERVKPLLLDVPDDRVAELFSAADTSVHPRGDGWTSGSLILSLSQGVAVVAARRPAYEELVGGEAAGWLFEPNDVGSLRAALAAAAADPELARRKGDAARRRADELRWADTAALMAARILPETPRRRGRAG